MKDYEEFEIDNIYLLLGHFLVKCQTLYSTLENCGDNFLAMDPDEMDSEVHYIFNIYTECADKLRVLDSQLASFPFLYISEKSQKLLHNEITSYLNGMECMYDLENLFGEVFEEYIVSGTSGNPANVSGIIAWQFAFCRKVQDIVQFCKRMMCRLEEINEEIKKREEVIEIACVYASPEEMRKTGDFEEETDIYPFIHAGDSEKAGQFCANCGKLVSIGTMICPYCRNNVQIARGTEPLMGNVYASPEMMSKTEKKESFVSKLFPRKK